MDWIKKCVKDLTAHEDHKLFEIGKVIESDKVKILDYYSSGSEHVAEFETPEKNRFTVSYIDGGGSSSFDSSCEESAQKISKEIHEIACTLKYDDLYEYCRVSRAKDGREFFLWLLKNPSEEIRLHMWELFKRETDLTEWVTSDLEKYVEESKELPDMLEENIFFDEDTSED